MQVRKVRPDERGAWLSLREQLWPDFSRAELDRELEEILVDSDRNCVLVVAGASGGLVGFVEVALRDWAEGCATRPVGYIEAWYVKPEHRRSGLGRKLIHAAERWVISRGCTEIGSDAELQNEVSHRAHRALGFTEVVRVVLFSKELAR